MGLPPPVTGRAERPARPARIVRRRRAGRQPRNGGTNDVARVALVASLVALGSLLALEWLLALGESPGDSTAAPPRPATRSATETLRDSVPTRQLARLAGR